jgi:3-hydroxyisobutyrate dehydrogenase-like beta-hydroxyacid dehydrogenase
VPIDHAQDPIGLIGLGAIGAPIGEALLATGRELLVADARGDVADEWRAKGAVFIDSAAGVADASTVVFASLPTPAVVRDVVVGAGGVLDGKSIEVFVDLSTTGATTARDLASLLGDRGVAYLDAPVSGGVAGARARSLTVMAAGAQDTFERVEPLLARFAKNVVHVGLEPGQGQTAKLLNNLLSATAMVATSEALAVGMLNGLRPELLLDVFNSSSGRNTATADKFPTHVLTREFGAGFRLDLMTKDVELCLAEARTMRAPMLVGAVVQQLWSLASRQIDDPEADHTRVIELFEDWFGVRVEAQPDT